MLTTKQITKLQANSQAFAIEQGWTNQQTLAFQILALFDRGFGIARSVELVCGEEALEEIADTPWTAQDLLDAVRSSFFS